MSPPSLVCVDETWHDCADVCAGAYEEYDDQNEGLEVEQGRLGNFSGYYSIRRSGGWRTMVEAGRKLE